MIRGFRVIAMAGQNPNKIQRHGGSDTSRYLLRSGIEDGGRKVGHTMVTGEKVRAEKQPEALAIIARMSVGMPRKMNRT